MVGGLTRMQYTHTQVGRQYRRVRVHSITTSYKMNK